jgi:hypothetical protein
MTDPNRSVNDVPALLDERRKYEAWLAALEARRESTPQHVFDRVKRDYDNRMRQVEEQLSAHRHSILEERTSLDSRRSLVAAEEQLRGDERAELELRAHVGELSSQDSSAAFKAIDEALAQMAVEKKMLSDRISELDALLEMRGPDNTEAGTPASSSVPIRPTAVTPPADGDAAKPSRQTPGQSFDELAFLSGVVGVKDETKDSAGHAAAAATVPNAPESREAIVKEEPASQSLLDDLGATNSDRSPFGAAVPASTPISLRASSVSEQSKTLKCTECGAMNYATEWYCERCGAELAAL